MQNGPIVNPRWQTLKRSSPTRREVKQTKNKREEYKSIVQENALLTYARIFWALKSHKEKKRKKELNNRKFKSGLVILFLYLSVGFPFLRDQGVEDFWATSGSCERQTWSWCRRVWDYINWECTETQFFFFCSK